MHKRIYITVHENKILKQYFFFLLRFVREGEGRRRGMNGVGEREGEELVGGARQNNPWVIKIFTLGGGEPWFNQTHPILDIQDMNIDNPPPLNLNPLSSP